ncbi:MAG: hypothetical protein QMD23_06780, partial [Candidatus Bathyarchaeia archaeon]|nr:hypothetical protein [Candidatus Bathyarchaeia archaeon]
KLFLINALIERFNLKPVVVAARPVKIFRKKPENKSKNKKKPEKIRPSRKRRLKYAQKDEFNVEPIWTFRHQTYENSSL